MHFRKIRILLWSSLLGCATLSEGHSCTIKVGPATNGAKVREQLLKITPIGTNFKSVTAFVKGEQTCKGLKNPKILLTGDGILKRIENPSGRARYVLVGDQGFFAFFGIYRYAFGLFAWEISAKYAFKNGKLVDIIPTVANPGGRSLDQNLQGKPAAIDLRSK